MIYGTGIDAVSISRVSKLIDRFGERFLRKIFSEDEIREGFERRDCAQFFAARFAAREAFFKALGTGWGRGISLKEVRVVRGPQGMPGFVFSDGIRQALEQRNIAFSHLSLTHEADLAQALVILEGG
ncbi:MAG: holo-ACP synthase [Candidatus Krumholzibacteria bacterium]|jgi:holo-[acyl-carrier protein] synthase|nr:holo-ACP synthase [Candidatus Krumholzibacteria bacterium]